MPPGSRRARGENGARRRRGEIEGARGVDRVGPRGVAAGEGIWYMKDGGERKIKQGGGVSGEKGQSVAEAHIPGGRPSMPRDGSNFPPRSDRLYRSHAWCHVNPKKIPPRPSSSTGFWGSPSYTGYPPSIFHSHSSRPIAGIVLDAAIFYRGGGRGRPEKRATNRQQEFLATPLLSRSMHGECNNDYC